MLLRADTEGYLMTLLLLTAAVEFSRSINFRPRTKRLDFGQSHSGKGTVEGHAPLPASVSES